MQRRLQRAVLIIAILVSATGAAFLMVMLRPEPPTRDVPDLAVLVDVVVLERSPAEILVRSQGTVRPRTETTLSAEVSGAIIEVSANFVAGGVFDADEVLLRIDPTDYLAAVEQFDALVKQRQIEYDGAARLRTQGFRAEAEFAAAEAALAAARSDLKRARRNLERTEIRVPYAGIVRSKDADIGQFVNPGTRLGVTFATDYAEVRLPLTDQDLAFVDLPEARDLASGSAPVGSSVVLSALREGVRREWASRIVRSESVVDESSRVSYAVVRVDDPYAFESDRTPLPVGTFVVAGIEGRSPGELIRVPRSVVRGSNNLVFVDDDNRLRIREVDIFRFDARYAYLRDMALEGERVVLTSLENPINGMRVRTTLDMADAASGDGTDPKLAAKDGEP